MKDTTRLTTEKRPARPAEPPAPPAGPSLLIWAPVAALAGFVLVLGVLYAGSKLHFGPAPAAPAAAPEEKEPKKEEDEGGRYQVEPVEDVTALFGAVGGLAFLGESTQEVRVYRYAGGLMECYLEVETFGQVNKGQTIPESWEGPLRQEPLLGKKSGGELRREGFIVVAAMKPVLSVNEALEPFYRQLGGMFVSGPAGPLHQLTGAHVETSHFRAYRILLTTGVPKGTEGTGFNVWTGQLLNVLLPVVPRDPMQEEFRSAGGKDLTPDQEITLMERRRGMSTVRLKARFVSDGKAEEMANKK
ncbi:MAG: hypothetical protein ACRC33_12965 [Gemmataceae bacterium]